MNIITKRDVIKSGVARFIEYVEEGRMAFYSQAKGVALRNLNLETCTADEVNEIICNTSWTDIVCHECDKSVEAVMCIGQPMDYESRTVYVCMDCLQAAVQSLQTTAVHIKTCNVYKVVGQAINATNEQSGQAMMAYERNGQMYVREAQEWSSKFIQQVQQ